MVAKTDKPAKKADKAAKKKADKPAKKVPPVPWRISDAKAQLEQDLEDGSVPLDRKEMMPKEVYNLPHRPNFWLYEYDNFRTNLNALRNKYKDQKKSSITDSEALARDLKKYPRALTNHRGEPRWVGSAAEKSLKAAVGAAAEAGNRKTVVNLYDEAEAAGEKPYKGFARRTVQKHIYQEENTIKFQAYLAYKKLKDQKKKEKKQKQAQQDAAEMVEAVEEEEVEEDAAEP